MEEVKPDTSNEINVSELMSKFWISVEDKLPENDVLVLVICKTYDPRLMMKLSYENWIFQGVFNRKKGWHVYFVEEGCYEVISWMPLPSHPKVTECFQYRTTI